MLDVLIVPAVDGPKVMLGYVKGKLGAALVAVSNKVKETQLSASAVLGVIVKDGIW